MKKMFIALIITLFSFTSINAIETTATEPDIVWTSVNAFSSYYFLKGTVDIPIAIKVLTFEIPVSAYHTVYEAGLLAEIDFLDAGGLIVYQLDWSTELGDIVIGEFEIDLEEFGIIGATNIEIRIPQTYSLTPSGYVTYIDSADSITFDYFATDRPYYFERVETTSYTRLEDTVEIPYNTYSITFDFSNIEYHIIYDTIYYSKIVLYDESMGYLDYYAFKDLVLFDNDFIALEFDEILRADAHYYDLVLYVSPDINYQQITYMNYNLDIFYNYKDLIKVEYYSLGELVNEVVVFDGAIPPSYEPIPPEGFVFGGWYFTDGTILYSYTGIFSNRAIDNVVKISAFYKADILTGEYSVDDPILDDTKAVVLILDAVGMANTTGFIIFYFLVTFIATLVLAIFKFSNLSITIIDLLILVLFTFWGILPLYVTVTGYILFIAMLLASLNMRGGPRYE